MDIALLTPKVHCFFDYGNDNDNDNDNDCARKQRFWRFNYSPVLALEFAPGSAEP